MGGLAMAHWKYIRATRDVDLLVAIEEGDLPRTLQGLAQVGIRQKHRQGTTMRLGQLQLVQLLYEPPETFVDLSVDLLLARSEYHLHALAGAVPARLPDLDLEVTVLTCEDLVLHKLLAGRLIDRADAVALLRANRDALKLEYLVQWSDRLGMQAELIEVWREVTAEPLPGLDIDR